MTDIATQTIDKAAMTRMLVIGDRLGIADIVERFEHRPKWRTDFTLRWDDAAARLRKHRYAVVLVYLEMSGPSELAIMRKFRAINPDVKIIFFVEQSTTEHVLAAIRSHAFSYYSYPFDLVGACQMIDSAAALTDWINGIEVLSAAPEYLTLRLRCSLDTADRLVQ